MNFFFVFQCIRFEYFLRIQRNDSNLQEDCHEILVFVTFRTEKQPVLDALEKNPVENSM